MSTPDRPEQPVYHLRLQALPLSAPAEVRMRRLLKSLLRCYGFRALYVEQLHEGDAQQHPGTGDARNRPGA